MSTAWRSRLPRPRWAARLAGPTPEATALGPDAVVVSGGRGLSSSSSRRAVMLVTLNYAVILGFARLLGFARESVIADVFGAGPRTDAYVAATAIPEVLSGIFLAGLVGYAVIPRLIFYERDTGDAAERFLNAAFTCIVVGCGLFALAAIASPHLILRLAAPGLERQAVPDATTMMRITGPAAVCFGLTGLTAAMLNARHRFLPVPVSLLVANGAGLLALALSKWIGIEATAVAYLATAAMSMGIQFMVVARAHLFPRLRLEFHATRLREMLAAGGIASVVVSVPYIRYLVERMLASTTGPGSLAALGFAGRTIFFAGTMIAVPAGTVVFPRLAERAAARDWRGGAVAVRRTLSLTLALSVPVAAAMAVFSRPVVRSLFEHGRFDRHATATTAEILRIYAIALVPICLIEILVRAYLAMGLQRLALTLVVGGLLVTIAVDAALLSPLGVTAVAVGAAVGTWLTFVVMAHALRRRIAAELAQPGIAYGEAS